ncbi:MAG TPA: hypothetical protein VNJ46_06865 [Gaiellaceae bacterium]|nr:hypothetical protein [Gaiellaceae bacterium]
MRLCMFHPEGRPLERGWVGRVEGDAVVQLAAQTLPAFFTGGGRAREHAVYRLAAVRLLAPVPHPPAVRVFERERSFVFANPAAIVGPEAAVVAPGGGPLALHVRLAAVVGREGALAGFTGFGEWRRPGREPPKDRDFALALGPLVATPDELEPGTVAASVRAAEGELAGGQARGFDWEAARAYAAEGTVLRPGDLLAGPALVVVAGIGRGPVEIELAGLGVLRQQVAG